MNLAAARTAFDGRVPGFLLRGMRMVSDGGRVELVDRFRTAVKTPEARFTSASKTPALHRAQEPQGGREPLECPFVPPEPETPVPELPSPAVIASDPEREAAIAELAQLSVLHAKAAAENERLSQRIEDARLGKGSSALAMSIALRKLAVRHNIRPVEFAPMPLLPDLNSPAVRFKGIAASNHVDAARTSFHRDCWGNCLDNPKAILLCLGHDEAKVVGTLETVELRAGAVWVTGIITDKAAQRMPALSISVMVEDHVIRDPDDRYAFRGEVTKISACNEITLTDHPQNSVCKVTERWPVTAADLIHQEMLDRIRRMRETIIAMRQAA